MSFDFPNAPTVGQIFNSWIWDGEKWLTQPVGSVRYDIAQSLTAPQQVQARQNIYSAPFDSLAYNGMQINGSMEVSQQNGASQITAPVTGNPAYIVDGWTISVNHAAAATIRGAQAGSVTSGGAYFSNCLNILASTAMSPVVAGDYAMFQQSVEGYRVARLGWGTASAQPVTIAFWIFATVAGHASLAVRALTPIRSYVADFTINAPGTWEYKTITIPGDTAGTWAKDNTVGVIISITLACGATFQTTAGVWVTGNSLGTPAQTNLLATANNNVYITGVVILPGIEAPSAARSSLIMRPYDQELMTCKRYWERIGMTMWTTATPYFNTSWYKVTKRATPTITALSTTNGAAWDVIAQSPLDGMRQTTVASTAADAAFSIDVRF